VRKSNRQRVPTDAMGKAGGRVVGSSPAALTKPHITNRAPRLRQAFYQGAAEEAVRRGRPLDGAELGRIIGHYPGDV